MWNGHEGGEPDSVSEMIASDILIIEDEPLIALDIEDTITSLGHRSVGIAHTHKEAVRLAKEKHPQLVLSDIQLADGSSGMDTIDHQLRRSGHFHHRLSRAPATRRTAGPACLITKPTFSPKSPRDKPQAFVLALAKGCLAESFRVRKRDRADR